MRESIRSPRRQLQTMDDDQNVLDLLAEFLVSHDRVEEGDNLKNNKI